MSAISHRLAEVVPERWHWSVQLPVSEMWASLANVATRFAVAVPLCGSGLLCPATGKTNTTTVPPADVIAVFASIGTGAVARHGFRHQRQETDRDSDRQV
jgi:hypothetical protein